MVNLNELKDWFPVINFIAIAFSAFYVVMSARDALKTFTERLEKALEKVGQHDTKLAAIDARCEERHKDD